MHNRKRFLGKKLAMAVIVAALTSNALMGCSKTGENASSAQKEMDYSNTPSGSELSATFKEKDTNTNWKDSSYTEITLNGSSIHSKGSGTSVSSNTLTIKNAGTYHISGTLTDGQIIVDAGSKDFVWIILDEANITNTKGAAIYAKQSEQVTITLADGTNNSVTDGANYAYSLKNDAPTACIFSKDDLSINGNGSLLVTSNSADGISTTNDLKIVSGNISITAADDGIRGKDSVAIKNGSITITASGDGIKSTNSKEEKKGYIYIENGTFAITAKQDGIQSEKSLAILDGNVTITTGGGAANAPEKKEEFPGPPGGFSDKPDESSDKPTATPIPTDAESTESTSYKAIKSGNDLYIAGGNFTIDSQDDAFHSNNTVNISNGTFSIQTGDDAMHADNMLTIEDGTITVSKCYEGLEAANIVLNGGKINVTSNDDGINASDGTDASQPGRPSEGDPNSQSSNATITINGGMITVTSEGDGLDANGSITQNGGTVYVNGPSNGGNGSLDYDSTYTMNGGSLIALGTAGMTQTPSSDSPQNTIYIKFDSTMKVGTELKLCDASGNVVLSCTATKAFNEATLNDALIKQKETYTLYNGTTKLCTITPTATITAVTETGEATTISEGGPGGHNGPGGNGIKRPEGGFGGGMKGEGGRGNKPDTNAAPSDAAPNE